MIYIVVVRLRGLRGFWFRDEGVGECSFVATLLVGLRRVGVSIWFCRMFPGFVQSCKLLCVFWYAAVCASMLLL